MAISPESYAADLASAWGARLKAVILYGSAASGDLTRNSDYNLLVVVDGLDGDRVRAAAKATARWVRAGNPAPLLMTPEFLSRSADVYPAEWLDILDHHRVLAGEDVVSGLRVESVNLRLELERELKSAWLKLLGRWQEVADSPRDTRELMIKSSSTFLTLFRGCLRLHGVRPLPPKALVPAKLAGYVAPEPFDPAIFDYIRALVSRDPIAMKVDTNSAMDRYLAAIAAVIRRIDART